MRVLYVEDTLSDIRLMQRIVQGVGHDLLIAVDGRQAVTLAGLLMPDLLFMDVRLPDIDGLQVVQTLRKRGFVGPIVAVTAEAFTSNKEACLRAGCTDYLAKPYEPGRILCLLKQYAEYRTLQTVDR